MTNRKKIGSVIRRHRKLAKLTFRELGRLSGIKWETVYSIEIGRGRLDAGQLALLTHVLGEKFQAEILEANTPKPKKVIVR